MTTTELFMLVALAKQARQGRAQEKENVFFFLCLRLCVLHACSHWNFPALVLVLVLIQVWPRLKRSDEFWNSNPCNARAQTFSRGQHCCGSMQMGATIRFADHSRTQEMLGLVAPKVWPVSNCTQAQAQVQMPGIRTRRDGLVRWRLILRVRMSGVCACA